MTPIRARRLPSLLLAALLAPLLLATAPAVAQAEPEVAPPTLSEPMVDPEVLRIELRPLTLEETQAAADAWLAMLQEIATGVADAEIERRDADAEAAAEIDERLTTLRQAQADAAARARLALGVVEEKGGDPATGRAYVDSVVGKAEIVGIESAADVLDASGRVVTWLKSEDGGIKVGLAIVKFVVIVIIARIVAGIVASLVRRAVGRMKKTSELLRDFLVNITRQAIFLVGVVVALGALGLDIGPLVAAIGGVAFVLGFALQGTLSNFAAGIMILMYRPYDIGNFVTVAGESGTVSAMNLVSTTLTTPDNRVIVIPNGSIWGSNITNVTGLNTRRVDLTFGIGYGDDIDKAMGILREVVEAHALVLKDPAPQIEVVELADSSVNFVCRPWSKTSDYWRVYFDLQKTVKQRFDAEGVSIPFPQRDVHVFQHAAD